MSKISELNEKIKDLSADLDQVAAALGITSVRRDTSYNPPKRDRMLDQMIGEACPPVTNASTILKQQGLDALKKALEEQCGLVGKTLTSVDKAMLPGDLRNETERIMTQLKEFSSQAGADRDLIDSFFEDVKDLQRLISANKSLRDRTPLFGARRDSFYGDLDIPAAPDIDLGPVLKQLDKMRNDPFYGDLGIKRT